MGRKQLTHPEGKNAISMDAQKYEVLKISFLSCLQIRKVAPFQVLLADVEQDLNKKKIKVGGKLEWNLFWVTLDLEANKAIRKDRSSSPIMYTII